MGRKNSENKEQKWNSKEKGEEDKENSHKYSNLLQISLMQLQERLTLFILILEANLQLIKAINNWNTR